MPDILITTQRGTSNNPSMQFTGSALANIKMEVLPSGSIAFIGTSGSLFSITDNLIGSLMSVGDVSGLPILEVFSDDRIVMGKYNKNTLYVSGTNVGIGKVPSSAVLDVSGSVAISGSLTMSGSGVTFTNRGTTSMYGVVNSFGTSTAFNIYGTLSTNIGAGSGNASVDIGVGRSADGNAYLNFVSENAGGTYPFYGLLIAKLSGASGKSQLIHRGTGDFEIKANEAAAISLQTSGTEKVRILSGGNVGIGTTSPGSLLHLNAASGTPYQTFSVAATPFGYVGAAGAFFSGQGSNFGMYGGGTSKIILGARNSPDLTIDTTGNVGIGTTSPTGRLQIHNASGNTIALYKDAGGAALALGSTTGPTDYALIESINGGGVRFYTGNGTVTERVRIDVNGNIGIGKSTPNSVLDINGNTTITGSLNVFNTADSVKVKASTGTSNLFASFQNTTGRIIIGCEGNTAGTLVTGAPAYAGIVSSTNGNELHLATADTSRIMISSGGNVGIGKTTPNAKLDVSGSMTVTGSALVTGTLGVTGTTTVSAVSVTGTITTSATEALRINNDSGYIAFHNTAGSTRTAYIQANAGSNFTFAAENGAAMAFSTNASTRMYINTSGNIGIGKTTPNSVLDINGNTTITGSLTMSGTGAYPIYANGSYGVLMMYSGTNYGTIVGTNSGMSVNSTQTTDLNLGTAGSANITIKYGGNVGIGKSTPNAVLDVNGNTIVTGSLSVVGAITATGNITAYFSDDRLKNNLGNIPDSLNKVLSLNGFYFEPNQTAIDFGYTKQKEVGVSAQQVQAILPEIIAAAPIDPMYMTVRYEKLIPLLIEAIKEQNSMIVDLQQKINRL